MNEHAHLCMDSPLGWLYIEEDENGITEISCISEPVSDSGLPGKYLMQAVTQLKEYFAHKRKEFDFPLSMQGSAFQKEVWCALQKIPYGETRTYGELGEMTKGKSYARAAGAACGRNRILIAVPCHRVIASDGSLHGFAYGLDKKQYLLDLERT